jgi:DNA-binding NtrC family response regulator
MNRNRIVLHVDDDPSMLRLVAETLGNDGYEVVSLDDPQQASRSLLTTGARVVLLDIDMPQVDGLTLLNELKAEDGGVQVIMVTGVVSMNTVLQSMRLGAEACVFKPLNDFDPLRTAVSAAFDKIDHWWDSLHDLNQRKTSLQPAVGK